MRQVELKCCISCIMPRHAFFTDIILGIFGCSGNEVPHYIHVWVHLFPYHLHSAHNSTERTLQEQTTLSFHTEVPNRPGLLVAHVVQNHI